MNEPALRCAMCGAFWTNHHLCPGPRAPMWQHDNGRGVQPELNAIRERLAAAEAQIETERRFRMGLPILPDGNVPSRAPKETPGGDEYAGMTADQFPTPVRTITFHGASDDLVEISGAPGSDNQNGNNPDAEDGEWNVDANPYGGAWDIVSEAEGQRLRVHAIYDGCWSFAVAMADEDERFPAWPCTVRPSAETAYSTELVIEAPNDARIVVAK